MFTGRCASPRTGVTEIIDHLSMTVLETLRGFFSGLTLCLTDQRVRQLALRPWAFAFVLYGLTLVGAYYTHPLLLNWMVSPTDSFFGKIWFGIAWLLVGLTLLIASLAISFFVALIVLSFVQEPLARHILSLENISTGSSPLLASIVRALLMIIVLSPVLIISLCFSLIPFLAPIGIPLAAWILAVQSFDPVFETLEIPVRKRFTFALSHVIPFIAFGSVLVLGAAVPFVGFVLPPFAVAGAAVIIGRSERIRSELALTSGSGQNRALRTDPTNGKHSKTLNISITESSR